MNKEDNNLLKKNLKREYRKVVFSKVISLFIFFIFLYFVYDIVLWKKIYKEIFIKDNKIEKVNDMPFPIVLGDVKISQSDRDYIIRLMNLLNNKSIKIIQIESVGGSKYKLLTDKDYYIKIDTNVSVEIVNNNFINIFVDKTIKDLLLSNNKLSYLDIGYLDKVFYKTKMDMSIEIEEEKKLKINNSDILVTATNTIINNLNTNNVVNINR